MVTMTALERARWALHVLNRSAELRWKYGPFEPWRPRPGPHIQTNLPLLRQALGSELEHVLMLHRDLLIQERARHGRTVAAQPPEPLRVAPPIWERPPW